MADGSFALATAGKSLKKNTVSRMGAVAIAITRTTIMYTRLLPPSAIRKVATWMIPKISNTCT